MARRCRAQVLCSVLNNAGRRDGGSARTIVRATLPATAASIATASGRRKVTIPVPAFGVRTAASLLDRFEQFPITRDQLERVLIDLGREPVAVE